VKRRIVIVIVGVLAMLGAPAGLSAASAGPSVPAKAKVLCVWQDLVPVNGLCLPTLY
jgi:hypothetical protein